VSPRRRLTREESKARTRQELLRAANRLFVRNGFVATSLADIAEEAGLTKGAVYSNFESKEDLFLALLEETGGDTRKRWAVREDLAPSDLSSAAGDTPAARARAWGEHLAENQPNRRNVALFLEMNAFALRNDRTRAKVAEHNREFFVELGTHLAELFDAPDADAEVLGLFAQSLYAGLQMHGAFAADPIDHDVFARTYELLAALAQSSTDRV
jgi:AcrR family transcriptional regulator